MLLKQKVAAHNPALLSDLKQAIKQMWMNEISVNCCEKLCLPMPERIDDAFKINNLDTPNIKFILLNAVYLILTCI